MEITRVPVQPVAPPPPDNVVIALTYQEAQYLKGIVNFFRRLATPTNFRGTTTTRLNVAWFAVELDRALDDAKVKNYTVNNGE